MIGKKVFYLFVGCSDLFPFLIIDFLAVNGKESLEISFKYLLIILARPIFGLLDFVLSSESLLSNDGQSRFKPEPLRIILIILEIGLMMQSIWPKAFNILADG